MSTRTSSEDAAPVPDSPPVDDETPDEEGAFPRLTDDQVATLEVGGTRRSVHTGEVLIREGAPSNDFFVILSGKVAVIDEGAVDGERRILRVHGPGRFLGELGLLDGQVAFFTAEVIEDGEVLVVPAERVRALVAHDLVLSDLILRAYLVRRHLLIGLGSGSGSSAPAIPRIRCGFGSSRCATDCPTGGSIWSGTNGRSSCCAAWVSPQRILPS